MQYFGITPPSLRYGLESVGLPVRAGLRHRVFGPSIVFVGDGVEVQDGIAVSVVRTQWDLRTDTGEYATLGISAHSPITPVPSGKMSSTTVVSQELNGAVVRVPAGGTFSFRVAEREYTVALLGVDSYFARLMVTVD
jgi:hypothetical protein